MTAAEDAIRILVADDHPVTRQGIALILDREPGLRVVAQAADGREAVELHRAHRPDVAVLDLQMPNMGGAEATAAILAEAPGARVLLLTTYDGDDDIYRGLRAGAKGYLLKGTPLDEVIGAVRAVHAGETVVPPEVGAKLAQRTVAPELSERELEVLRLVAEGCANKEIATRLGISEGTVKSHMNALMSKLDATGRTEAAMTAVRRGLLRGG